jgi:hypothetical protein
VLLPTEPRGARAKLLFIVHDATRPNLPPWLESYVVELRNCHVSFPVAVLEGRCVAPAIEGALRIDKWMGSACTFPELCTFHVRGVLLVRKQGKSSTSHRKLLAAIMSHACGRMAAADVRRRLEGAISGWQLAQNLHASRLISTPHSLPVMAPLTMQALWLAERDSLHIISQVLPIHSSSTPALPSKIYPAAHILKVSEYPKQLYQTSQSTRQGHLH